jgi:hypothetical protein
MWQGEAHGQANLHRQVVIFNIWSDVCPLIGIIHRCLTKTPHPLRPEDQRPDLHKMFQNPKLPLVLYPLSTVGGIRKRKKITHTCEVVNISKMLRFNIWNDVD